VPVTHPTIAEDILGALHAQDRYGQAIKAIPAEFLDGLTVIQAGRVGQQPAEVIALDGHQCRALGVWLIEQAKRNTP
jgi:hypothetical protein